MFQFRRHVKAKWLIYIALLHALHVGLYCTLVFPALILILDMFIPMNGERFSAESDKSFQLCEISQDLKHPDVKWQRRLFV